MTKCVSPWYNCTGWLGVKHQLTYLLVLYVPSFLDYKVIHFPQVWHLHLIVCSAVSVNKIWHTCSYEKDYFELKLVTILNWNKNHTLYSTDQLYFPGKWRQDPKIGFEMNKFAWSYCQCIAVILKGRKYEIKSKIHSDIQHIWEKMVAALISTSSHYQVLWQIRIWLASYHLLCCSPSQNDATFVVLIDSIFLWISSSSLTKTCGRWEFG